MPRWTRRWGWGDESRQGKPDCCRPRRARRRVGGSMSVLAPAGRADGVCASVVEAIGRTPAVELARLTRGLSGRVVAKLEYLNPGLSKKDRIAREMVDDAMAAGELRAGQPVVELTS